MEVLHSSARRRLLLTGALMAVGAPAAAAGLTAKQAQAVQAVIRAQLAAFAADDAEAAFAHATPGIRAGFGTAERFLGMVKQGYPMVYRPAAVVFLKPLLASGEVLQGVRITDAAGRVWDVVYQLQRQPDGAWRIAGCQAEPSSGTTT